MLLFRLARRRAFDIAGVIVPMAEGYDTAMAELDALVSYAREQGPRVRAGHPRAGSGRGRRAAPVGARRPRSTTRRVRCSRSVASPPSGTCWSTALSSPRAAPCSSGGGGRVRRGPRGGQRGARRRAPADRACSTRCRAGRGPAGGRWWSTSRGCAGSRTQVLGRAPGFAPGPPVVGPYRPMVLSTGERPAPEGRVDGPWWPHTHGDAHPRGAPDGREPFGRIAGPLGQRRAGVRARRGVDTRRPRGARHRCRAGVQPGPGQRDLGVRERRLLPALRRARADGLAGPDVRHVGLPALGRGFPGARSRPRCATSSSGCAAPVRRGRLRERRARAAGHDVRDQPRHRVRRRAGVVPAPARRRVRDGRGLGRQLAERGRPCRSGSTRGIAQYFGVGAYLRDLAGRPALRRAVRVRVPGVRQPARPGASPGRRAAGQRRRLGLRRRPRALPAARYGDRGDRRRTRSGSPAR